MKVHFIAIGGSAMHNLAIALSRKGIVVSGSDDEIFEPSKTRLDKQGILPNDIGWNPSIITEDLDAVILGMHAREDNPELLKAKELGIKIYSYPEYLYEQSKDKIRIVIGGSHGKTSITSMLLHVMNKLKINVDYMVGAQLEGYDCMVRLSESANYMILEGDEYLSSPIDLRPKFHLYKPNIALLSGIAWDHINVFPTFENYIHQFDVFCSLIQSGGSLIYNSEDEEVNQLGIKYQYTLTSIPYQTPIYSRSLNGTILRFNQKEYKLNVFGAHNLQNVMGAMSVAKAMSVEPDDFFTAIQDFSGAGKRLQKVIEKDDFVMFKDFAHSPSKLAATTNAVREQFPNRQLIACMELHTFSSLKKEFLPYYKGCMDMADVAIVYFSPEVVQHKKLEPISKELVQSAFGGKVLVLDKTSDVLDSIYTQKCNNAVLLMMSSGNFDGINYEELGATLTTTI